MEITLIARGPECWLRDPWCLVELASGKMMLSASRAIIPLRMLSLQPCLEFRADKFVTKTYQDLLFIALSEVERR